MSILITGRDLPEMKGTLLKPEGPLPAQWQGLTTTTGLTLVLTQGATTAALALKVWPQLQGRITRIIYAGGTFERGDATPWAEQTVWRDPAAMESLLNAGIPIWLCTTEAAAAHGMTTAALAEACAMDPDAFSIVACGVHAEYDPASPACGKLTRDLYSMNRYPRNNVELVL